MIGVTLGTGEWFRIAELAAQATKRCTGLETRIIGDREWEQYRSQYCHPHFVKLHLWEFVSDDDVFYFDADAFHLNAWDPTIYAGREEFVAAIDPYIGGWAEEAGVPAGEYFNSGVMFANRRHHLPMFETAQLFARTTSAWKRFKDQTSLNMARSRLGIPLHVLPPKYNHMRFFSDPQFSPADTVIAHWTPHHLEGDIARVEQFAQLCARGGGGTTWTS